MFGHFSTLWKKRLKQVRISQFSQSSDWDITLLDYFTQTLWHYWLETSVHKPSCVIKHITFLWAVLRLKSLIVLNVVTFKMIMIILFVKWLVEQTAQSLPKKVYTALLPVIIIIGDFYHWIWIGFEPTQSRWSDSSRCRRAVMTVTAY